MASIAEIIRRSEREIIKCWVDRARATASARGLSPAALENVMASYLAALAAELEGEATAHDRRMHLQEHLGSRLRQGFDLAEILSELVILERCIIDTWSSLPEDERPSAGDIDRLHVHVHLAMTEAMETFHRHMLEDEQAEKRYLRLLQAIASEALQEDATPLRQRLAEVLEVVMKAMDARCAALLAYDTAEARPTLVACTGVAALEPYVTSLDPTALAGREHAAPTVEATWTQLGVPDSLQQAGIRSLLGVRLPSSPGVIRVMYIGIGEARDFTPREIGRIASLGERLSLQLENATLVAALHDKIATLNVERSLRERFVSLLAHDLRGPLAAARLAADILAMSPASLEERRDLALKIDRNIDRVDRMIRDLLDANRIEAGERLPLRLDTCDLVALAERVAEEARALHGDRFIVDAEPGSIRGIWSEDELHRALWNLVTNAVKYGEARQPITIAVRRHGDGAQLSVHNTGPAIPGSDQAHIFDAYARTRSADAGDRGGWGLGLTLVRGAAEAHGGHVSVQSDPASGTTFTIELPLDARAARASADAGAHATVH